MEKKKKKKKLNVILYIMIEDVADIGCSPSASLRECMKPSLKACEKLRINGYQMMKEWNGNYSMSKTNGLNNNWKITKRINLLKLKSYLIAIIIWGCRYTESMSKQTMTLLFVLFVILMRYKMYVCK